MRTYCLIFVFFLLAVIRTTESQQDYYCYEPTDIVVLLDSSREFGRENFVFQKRFAKNFITFFRLERKGLGPHVAFIPYSDRPITRSRTINFYYSTSLKRLSDKIDKLSFGAGNRQTRPDLALQYARETMFRKNMGARSWVPRAVLMVTGSFRTWTKGFKQNLLFEAERMRKRGIRLLVAAVALTEQSDVDILKASVGLEDIFMVMFPYGLVQVAKQMVQRICPVPTVFPCPGVVDIAFIVDSSGSISRDDYRKTKYFVFSIANALNVSADGAHAGVVIYSTYAEMAIKFTDHTNIADFQSAVYDLDHMKKFTRIDLGLRTAHSMLFTERYGGARQGVKKVAFILTDGEQNPDEKGLDISVGDAAKPLMEDNIKTFSIGIGSKVNKDELRAMVEFDEDVITVASFDELIKKIQNITEQTCEEITYSKCDYPADFAFVLDSSATVRDSDFEKAKGFVKTMAKLFRIFQYGSRGAVIVYGDRAQLAMRMGAYRNYPRFIKAVDGLVRVGGRRRTYKALDLAEEVLSDYGNGARRKVPKVVLLLTAGPEYSGLDFTELKQVTTRLHSRNMLVLVVGVGSGFNMVDIRSLVVSSVNLFLAESFTQLKDQLVPLSNETCDKIGPGVCEAKVDLAFILDSSGSIEEEEFDEAKNFVQRVAQTFLISPQKTHVALMIYSDDAQIISRFGQINSQSALVGKLNSLPHLKGKTRIDLALKKAARDLFSWSGGMRTSSSVAKVAIVITDGRQSPAPDEIGLDEAAADMLVQGVKVISIGVGDNIDQYELNMMVEDPDKHTFWSESYRALRVQLATIARESCSRKTYIG